MLHFSVCLFSFFPSNENDENEDDAKVISCFLFACVCILYFSVLVVGYNNVGFSPSGWRGG